MNGQTGKMVGDLPADQKASEITNTYGINVNCLLTKSSNGLGTVEYVEQIYKGSFGDADGIMLIDSEEDNEWFIYKSGKANDLFTADEETELLSKLDEISERQKCDVAVVTVEGLEGKTPEAYADDFYDYNGYGYGEERDGIIFLISMEERKWQISTCGFGITAFTDAGQEYMADPVEVSDLKK